MVRRVIVVGGNPVAYMWDSVPSVILSPADVNGSFTGSVLDLLRQKQDVHVAQAVANIVAVNADAVLSEKLKVQQQQALLLFEETVYGDQGLALEFSRNYFIPEFFRFRVVRR
jgi:GntR family transcriptional regulator